MFSNQNIQIENQFPTNLTRNTILGFGHKINVAILIGIFHQTLIEALGYSAGGTYGQKTGQNN